MKFYKSFWARKSPYITNKTKQNTKYKIQMTHMNKSKLYNQKNRNNLLYLTWIFSFLSNCQVCPQTDLSASKFPSKKAGTPRGYSTFSPDCFNSKLTVVNEFSKFTFLLCVILWIDMYTPYFIRNILAVLFHGHKRSIEWKFVC